MRKFGIGLGIVLAGLLVAIGPSAPPAVGCAVIWRPSAEPVKVAAERALIVWEAEYRTQHFIRAAQFRGGNAEDFGFLVPTPTQPELSEADNAVFDLLEQVTKPREIRTTVIEKIPCRGNKFAMVGSALPAPMSDKAVPPSVAVLDRKTVGAFQAAVLKANDAAALNTWLATNSYQSRPELQTWLAKYVQNGWIITAFKMKPGANAGNAIRLSFATDKPFYPYREPADAKPTDGTKTGRKLRLFLLGGSRLKVTHDDPAVAWLGHTVWSARLNTENFSMLPELIRADASTAVRLKNDWHLTEYEDLSDPRPATDELSIAVAEDQTIVERPPIYRTHTEYVEDCSTLQEITELPAAWLALAGAVAVVLALGGFVLLRRRLR